MSEKTLVLVDASFTTFYRFFATMRWYSFSKKEEYKACKGDNKYDWSKNVLFMEKYEKMYFEEIEKTIGKKNIKNCIVIFCQDASQNTLWRHKLVSSSEDKDQYKGERPDLDSKYNFGDLFNYTYNKMIPKAKKEKDYPIHQLKYKETEADDIIATISMYLEKKLNSQKIIIVSGDDDFTQLGRENVGILNYRKKKIEYFDKKETDEKLRLKIIMGDKSDNIPSIFPKSRKEVSLKQRKEIKESKSAMVKFLNENKEIRKKYLLNQKLIDFTKIPKFIQNPILKDFKKLQKDF